MWKAADVWFRYSASGEWLFSKASLQVAPGEVLGLYGLSGEGKSTLGRIMCGLLRPTKGTVLLNGHPQSIDSGSAAASQMVFQHPRHSINPLLKVRAILGEASREHHDGPALGLVSQTWLDRYPHELSEGQLQRVNLARALLVKPQYIVADEITASLDAVTQVHIWNTIRTHVTDGLGVIAISHNASLLARVADRIVEMREICDTTRRLETH